MPVTTQTGKEFPSAEEALAYVRACSDMMLDPEVDQPASLMATTELLYTVKALDEYLSRGGTLPVSWRSATPAFGYTV